MKYTKYLLVFLLLLTAACNDDDADSTIRNDRREAFLAADEVGIYEDGVPALQFDPTTQQLTCAPSKFRFCILDNAGDRYVEIRLDAMPQQEKGVTTFLTNSGFDLTSKKMTDVVLLKREGDLLWLWSDATRTGMILQWIEL